MTKLSRAFINVHRWMGLFLSLLLGMWFLSGFVMLYVDFPEFGSGDRRAHAAALDMRKCKVLMAGGGRSEAVGGGVAAHGKVSVERADTGFVSLRISGLLGRPVLIGERSNGDVTARYTDDGQPLSTITEATAKQIAVAFFSGRCQPAVTERITELDQWIPRYHFLVHMPVYRVRMDDMAGTWLYISSKTGEIIQRHTRRERILAWLGPIPHWIYPKELIIRRPVWRQVVIWLSFAGALMCLSGIVAGLVRLRRSRRTDKLGSPYKKRWLRWHHYTGLFFGLFTLTWVFSGLLSMNPLYWSPETALSSLEQVRWQGGELSPGKFTGIPVPVMDSVAEVRLTLLQGKPYYILYKMDGRSVIRSGNDTSSASLDKGLLLSGLRDQQPGVAMTEANLLTAEDNYYYSKNRTNKLPVWRVKFADARQTWYYVDPSTGDVLLKYDRTSRLNRWVYHGLHSLDFSSLLRRRPLWDIVVIILLLGGTAVSVTGVVLTWKRIWLRKTS